MITTTPQPEDTPSITEKDDQYPDATFTIAISDHPNLTKKYDLDDDGKIVKTHPGKISSGIFRTRKCNLKEFADGIQSGEITAHHAIIHGVCGHSEVEATTKARPRDNAIPRTKEHFFYPENALIMFDHDHNERGRNYAFKDHEIYLNDLEAIDPQLLDVAFFVKPSSSAGLRKESDPDQGNESGGFHVYAVVRDGGDLKRYAEALSKHLIIGGFGYCFISKAGSCSVRTIFDLMVHNPERLDYIHPAIAGGGLVIDQPDHKLYPGKPIDTHLLPDLSDYGEQIYQKKKQKILEDAKEEAVEIREKYLEQRSVETKQPIAELRVQYQMSEKGEIDWDHVLFKNDGAQFNFQDALGDPDTYHKLSMRDPFEPDYGEDKAKLYINQNGFVFVHSYCHGERTYRLCKDGVPYLNNPQKAVTADFSMVGIGEILTEPPPMEWLLQDYIIRGAQCQLVGESTVGKTFFTVALALSIATGRDFMGKRVKQGAVAYINAEGHTGFKWRVKAYEQEYGTLTGAPFFLSEQSTNFLDEGCVVDVTEALDNFAKRYDGKIEAIFVDTLHRNMQGDENSSHDFGVFMEHFQALCGRYHAAGIVNHHPGHGSKNRGRGSSSQRASLDTELLLSKKEGRTLLQHMKLKDGGPTQSPVTYHLREVTIPWKDVDGNCLTTCVPEFSEFTGSVGSGQKPVPKSGKFAIQTLVKAMDGKPAATYEQWREAFSAGYVGTNPAMKKAFSRAVKMLPENKVVVVNNGEYRFADCIDSPWSDVGDYVPPFLSVYLKQSGDHGVKEGDKSLLLKDVT